MIELINNVGGVISCGNIRELKEILGNEKAMAFVNKSFETGLLRRDGYRGYDRFPRGTCSNSNYPHNPHKVGYGSKSVMKEMKESFNAYDSDESTKQERIDNLLKMKDTIERLYPKTNSGPVPGDVDYEPKNITKENNNDNDDVESGDVALSSEDNEETEETDINNDGFFTNKKNNPTTTIKEEKKY